MKLLGCSAELLLQLMLKQDLLLSKLLVCCEELGVVFWVLLRCNLKSRRSKYLPGMGIHLIVAGHEISIVLASGKAATNSGLRHSTSVQIIGIVWVSVLADVLLVVGRSGSGRECSCLGSGAQACKQVRPARSWSRRGISLLHFVDGGDLGGRCNAQSLDIGSLSTRGKA